MSAVWRETDRGTTIWWVLFGVGALWSGCFGRHGKAERTYPLEHDGSEAELCETSPLLVERSPLTIQSTQVSGAHLLCPQPKYVNLRGDPLVDIT